MHVNPAQMDHEVPAEVFHVAKAGSNYRQKRRICRVFDEICKTRVSEKNSFLQSVTLGQVRSVFFCCSPFLATKAVVGKQAREPHAAL